MEAWWCAEPATPHLVDILCICTTMFSPWLCCCGVACLLAAPDFVLGWMCLSREGCWDLTLYCELCLPPDFALGWRRLRCDASDSSDCCGGSRLCTWINWLPACIVNVNTWVNKSGPMLLAAALLAVLASLLCLPPFSCVLRTFGSPDWCLNLSTRFKYLFSFQFAHQFDTLVSTPRGLNSRVPAKCCEIESPLY